MKMSDEEERAIAAAGKDENGDSIFGAFYITHNMRSYNICIIYIFHFFFSGKIVRKEIKADIVYEDDKVTHQIPYIYYTKNENITIMYYTIETLTYIHFL